MTVKELCQYAEESHLLDDDALEVVEYFKYDVIKINRGTCASCKLRKTSECPWPHQSKLITPVCTTYKPYED